MKKITFLKKIFKRFCFIGCSKNYQNRVESHRRPFKQSIMSLCCFSHLHCGGGRGPGVPRGARQRHPHLAGGGIVADRVLNAAEALSLADADRVPGIYEKTRAIIRLQSGCLVFFGKSFFVSLMDSKAKVVL